MNNIVLFYQYYSKETLDLRGFGQHKLRTLKNVTWNINRIYFHNTHTHTQRCFIEFVDVVKSCISQNHKEKTDKKPGCRSAILIGFSETVKGTQALEDKLFTLT